MFVKVPKEQWDITADLNPYNMKYNQYGKAGI
jgi:hypothetical protein